MKASIYLITLALFCLVACSFGATNKPRVPDTRTLQDHLKRFEEMEQGYRAKFEEKYRPQLESLKERIKKERRFASSAFREVAKEEPSQEAGPVAVE